MTTTAIIILSVLLGGSVCMNIAGSVQRKRKNAKIDALKRRINNQNEERESADMRYHIYGYENGHYSVYRVTAPYTIEAFHTLIKTFDTNDSEYNYNEAVELKESLERKLCYD